MVVVVLDQSLLDWYGSKRGWRTGLRGIGVEEWVMVLAADWTNGRFEVGGWFFIIIRVLLSFALLLSGYTWYLSLSRFRSTYTSRRTLHPFVYDLHEHLAIYYRLPVNYLWHLHVVISASHWLMIEEGKLLFTLIERCKSEEQKKSRVKREKASTKNNKMYAAEQSVCSDTLGSLDTSQR